LRLKYRSIGMLFALALVFALVPAVAMAAQGVGGVILDGTSGMPVPFAHVSLLSSATPAATLGSKVAAYDGSYWFDADVDTFTVEAGAADGPYDTYDSSKTAEFKVAAAAATAQNVVLDRWATYRQPVYRFFNMTGGVHFYTASNDEFINVYKTLSNFKYDGVGYWIPQGPGYEPDLEADEPGLVSSNGLVLQRFFNMKTGVHFYTADPTEFANVKNNLASIYHYDGPAYDVAVANSGLGLPVFRFYNGTTNAHFYTLNTSEIDGAASLAGTFKFEGVGFNTGDWLNTWALSYSGSEGGTVTPVASRLQIVLEGSDGTTVTATPDANFSFSQWSDGNPNASRRDLDVNMNVDVTAEFVAE